MENNKKLGDLHIRISPEAKAKLEQICSQEHRTQRTQIEYWISQFKLNDEKEKC